MCCTQIHYVFIEYVLIALIGFFVHSQLVKCLRFTQLRQSFHQFTSSVLGDGICHRRRCREARHKDGNVFIGIEATRFDAAEAEGAIWCRYEAVDVRDGGPVCEIRLQKTPNEQ